MTVTSHELMTYQIIIILRLMWKETSKLPITKSLGGEWIFLIQGQQSGKHFHVVASHDQELRYRQVQTDGFTAKQYSWIRCKKEATRECIPSPRTFWEARNILTKAAPTIPKEFLRRWGDPKHHHYVCNCFLYHGRLSEMLLISFHRFVC